MASDSVLAQLKVVIGADTAQLKSGLNEAQISVEKSSRNIEGSFHRLGQVIERLVGPLSETGRKLALGFDALGGASAEASKGLGGVAGHLGIIAGVGAGIGVGAAAGLATLAARAAEAGAGIYDASEKTGIAADKMSAIAALAKETGGDFEGLTKSLSRFGVNLTNALIDPSTIGARELQSLLGGAKGLTELGLKPMGDRLQFVMQKIFSLNDAGQQHAMLQALLGRGWMENVDALQLLATQGYGPAIEQARKFGIYFDDSSARQAKQFTEEWKTLKGEFEGLALAIGQSLIPAFNHLMVDLVGTASLLQNVGHGIRLAFKTLTDPGANVSGKFSSPTQEMTDFLIHVQALTSGAEHGTGDIGDISGHHTKGIKEKTDALAQLIKREQDELNMLQLNTGKLGPETEEYRRNVEAIQKASEKTHNLAEEQTALNLALDIFLTKLQASHKFKVELPDLRDLTKSGFTMPEFQGIGANKTPTLTLSQISAMPGGFDNQAAQMRALDQETQLSSEAFAKLAAQFPRLTENEVAATAAGQKFIDTLSRMDQQGAFEPLNQKFLAVKEQIIEEGYDLGGKLADAMGRGIEGLENQLTSLIVTGKANWTRLLQSIEGDAVHAFIQKGVSSLLGGIFGGNGSKPDGSANNPLYVTPVGPSGNQLGGLAGGIFGGGFGGLVPGFPSDGDDGSDSSSGGIFSSLKSSLGKMLSGAGGGFLGILGKIGGMFGGFLAGGGDVTPGKAYVVGEKHPEFFVPRASGQVVPTIKTGPEGKAPMIYSPVYNISTPNVDGFRKSQSQLITEGYRQAAMAHARNS